MQVVERKKKNYVNYLAWYAKHEQGCSKNHEGSAGKMKVDVIAEMYLQSI